MNIFLYVAVYCASVLTPIIPIRVSPDNDSAIVIYTDSTCKAIEKRFSSKELRETEVYVSFNKDSKLAAGDRIWTWVEGEIQPEFFGWVKKEHCRVSFSDDIYLFREPDIYSAKERFAINRPISADVLSVRDGWLELRLNYGGV